VDIALRIQDPSGEVRRDVMIRIDERSTVRDLVDALVDVLEWPRVTFAGNPHVYQVRRLRTNDPIASDASVTSLSLQQGEVLVVGSH
jgi:hypothetical protein